MQAASATGRAGGRGPHSPGHVRPQAAGEATGTRRTLTLIEGSWQLISRRWRFKAGSSSSVTTWFSRTTENQRRGQDTHVNGTAGQGRVR